jgi:hypothetical protein
MSEPNNDMVTPAEPAADAGKTMPQPPDAATLRTERDQARAELAQIREVLRIVEWGGDKGMPDFHCPRCSELEPDGHAAGCTLAAAIAGHVEHPAVVELAQIRRALELTGHVLPDIDEAVWEYSPAGSESLGVWPDMWIGQEWEENEKREDYMSYLTRRRRKLRRVRRAPTDADAIEQPRRECWARTDVCSDWEPMRLLAVEPEPPIGYRPCYIVMSSDGFVVKHTRCEIEVEA